MAVSGIPINSSINIGQVVQAVLDEIDIPSAPPQGGADGVFALRQLGSGSGQALSKAIADNIYALVGAGGGGAADLTPYALASQVPTIEDIAFNGTDSRTLSASDVLYLWVAPFPCRITAAYGVSPSSVPQSATDYWDIALGKWPFTSTDSAIVPITSKSTQTNLGESVFLRKAWAFDTAAFDPVNSVCLHRDVVGFRFTKVGVPTSITRMNWTIRYEPLPVDDSGAAAPDPGDNPDPDV